MTGPLSYLPRRAEGLPPGQREVRVMPRFSDQPLRPPPPMSPISLRVSCEGSELATVDADRLAAVGRREQIGDLHCVTTWSFRNLRWAGTPMVDLVDELFGDRSAIPAYAVASAADGAAAIFVTEDLLDHGVMLATDLDGEPLGGRHGGPLRLVTPGQYGYKNVKHLQAIDFVAERPASRLGPKEHLRARVDREERHATLPNWILRVPYRLLIVPTAVAAERPLRNRSGPVVSGTRSST